MFYKLLKNIQPIKAVTSVYMAKVNKIIKCND